MYLPPHAKKIADFESHQIRLALMGASKTGKTYSALTFPNPIVIDIDNNLLEHKNRKDVLVLPFHDTAWVDSLVPRKNNKVKYPVRDAVLWWLEKEACKLEKDQTLVLDSWSTLQDEFDKEQDLNPAITASGKVDDYGFWKEKIEYSTNICGLFKSLKCHVVVAFHEQDNRDSTGQLTGKVEPLMQGKFVKKLSLYFTHLFRCTTESVFDTTDKKKIVGTKYSWQTRSSSEVNLGGRGKFEMFCKPEYNTLLEAIKAQ